MPLQLPNVSHERGQLILFDPGVPEERRDALKRFANLRRRGFVLKKSNLKSGKIELVPPPRSEHEHLFRILSENGDDHIVWDRRDPRQVREAFTKFKDFIKQGYSAYATTSDGKKSHRIDEFDPHLEEVVLSNKEVVLVPKTMPG